MTRFSYKKISFKWETMTDFLKAVLTDTYCVL